jgi:hypothetical protein
MTPAESSLATVVNDRPSTLPRGQFVHFRPAVRRIAIQFEFAEMVARSGHGAGGKPIFLPGLAQADRSEHSQPRKLAVTTAMTPRTAKPARDNYAAESA